MEEVIKYINKLTPYTKDGACYYKCVDVHNMVKEIKEKVKDENTKSNNNKYKNINKYT